VQARSNPSRLNKRLAVMSEAAPHIRRAPPALLDPSICCCTSSDSGRFGALALVLLTTAPPADAWELIQQFKLARYANMSELHRNSIGGIKKCVKDLER